jgi:hypothetical protein
MKISIVVWDANFRENLHAIDYFGKQDYVPKDYEFLWVDYYHSNSRVREAISKYPNFKLITLDNDINSAWHLGKCMNKGVEMSSGEILILPDGDISVEQDFLQHIASEHQKYDDLVLYHRRFDEQKQSFCEKSTKDIDYLKKNAVLNTATNFGGCYSILRCNFEKTLGYEEHPAFSGPGMNAMEINARFRNLGLVVKWSRNKHIYHPWHENSTKSIDKQKERNLLAFVRAYYNWINPYAGLEQSWIYHQRNKSFDVQANSDQCDEYIQSIPAINMEVFSEKHSLINK